MDSRPLVLSTDAPLDAHTAELLRGFDPTDEVVCNEGSTAETLRAWSRAAATCRGRLVLADSRLHAEQQALANLLDTPGLQTAVLLAHNGDDSVDLPVRVADGLVAPDGGQPRQAAGILLIASSDCAAFARAAATAADELDNRDAPAGTAWQIALRIAGEVSAVAAVEAAPFCASCAPMELPSTSEDDRRLRASADAGDDALTGIVLRPFSRRLTKLAVPAGRTSTSLILLGVALGVAAALITAPGNAVSSIVGGVVFLTANVALLSAGELPRYRRRPDADGARWHRFASRGIEVAFILALAVAAARTGDAQWLLATAAVGLSAVTGNAIAAREMVSGSAHRNFRSLRWSAIALALIVAGPGWALLLAALGSAAVLTGLALGARSHAESPTGELPATARFLGPLGSLLDAGVPVRAISGAAGPRFRSVAGRLVAAGVAGVFLAAAWSWGARSWPLVLAIAAWVVLTGLALGTAPSGRAAWTVPAVARAVEVVILVAAASTLPNTARFAAFMVAAGLYLASMEVADRWRYGGQLPAPWRSLIDLGFDGRSALLAIGLAAGAGAATWVLTILAVLLLGLAAISAARWRSHVGQP